MAGMGPAPKPTDQRARRNATFAMTRLPGEGRKGRAPAWPLIDDVILTAKRDMAKDAVASIEEQIEAGDLTPAKLRSARATLRQAKQSVAVLNAQLAAQRKLERTLWIDLWKTPQATQWQRLHWTREVAQYVRHKVLAELGSLDDAKEARQIADRIGLTPLSLLRLRWEIADPAPTQRRTATRSRRASRYSHLKVVG